MIILALLAGYGIPLLPSMHVRFIAWAIYGFFQGLVMTGFWVSRLTRESSIKPLIAIQVLGHECGHMAFAPSAALNDTIGFIIHSSLLTPYFSWKSTHRRHHIYANNLEKDHNYVPPRREAYIDSLSFSFSRLDEITNDSPLVTLLRILLQQVFGFPWYLLTNITASEGSLHRKKSEFFLGNSHFLPSSTLFRPEEAPLVLLSDLGIIAMASVVWYSSSVLGLPMGLLYVQPWMWVNHWIVAITYLHHTHPNLPKYENAAWTFLKGATATIDLDLGWIGRHLLHGISEYHVVHHLFS